MVAIQLYVEGGGESKALRTACREGFRSLLEKAGLRERMPRVTAAGGRRAAYEGFFTALASTSSSRRPVLLVDSESAVFGCSPWDHVKQRSGDGWERPMEAADVDLQLMVQCMETWFLADRRALQTFFGQGFREKALPAATTQIETVPKTDLFTKLKQATGGSETKGGYDKGRHSFALLATLDPVLIRRGSFWAERFFDTLDRLTGGVAL
jgi:hypothetical protein